VVKNGEKSPAQGGPKTTPHPSTQERAIAHATVEGEGLPSYWKIPGSHGKRGEC